MIAIAMYTFTGNKVSELNLKIGDKLKILDKNKKKGWLYGYKLSDSQKVGFFPKVFIKYLNNEYDSM